MSSISAYVLNRYGYVMKYIPYVIIIMLFVLVGYFFFRNSWSNLVSPTKFSDMANSDLKGKDVTIYFFTVDWCPHCKNAKPEWDKFVTAKNGKIIKGHKVHCRLVNCTSDNTEFSATSNEKITIAAMINKYDIKGYPTIKLTTDNGDTIEYDSKITSQGLVQFVDTVLDE